MCCKCDLAIEQLANENFLYKKQKFEKFYENEKKKFFFAWKNWLKNNDESSEKCPTDNELYKTKQKKRRERERENWIVNFNFYTKQCSV